MKRKNNRPRLADCDCPETLKAFVADPENPALVRASLLYRMILQRRINPDIWAAIREEYEAELVRHGLGRFNAADGTFAVVLNGAIGTTTP